nr:FAD-dependent oxidoreductase [Rhodopirellula sp. SM50]
MSQSMRNPQLLRTVFASGGLASLGLERSFQIRWMCLFVVNLLLLPLGALNAADHSPDSPDVVVYGATPAGIAAALHAAEADRGVWLVEPTGRIGGMTTHGLSHSDFHSFEALNGPFLHFSQRVLQHYQTTYGKDSDPVKDSWQGTHGEPSVNLLVFEKMLAEVPTISVLTNHRLVAVDVEDSAIVALHFAISGSKQITVKPPMVIDASYEGDLLAAAGVPYRVGREARSEYGESLAPETADGQVQGYNFRLCMTQNESNRVPIPVPDNYNREDYAAIVPLVKAGAFDAAFGYPGRRFILKAHLPVMPNGKHDINDVSKGLVRLSLPGHNRDYPEGDVATRRRIEKKHLDWQLGLMHFVQTDPELPDAFREAAGTWGLCRDEFADSGHIPPQIYVREARRMVGQRVFTEADTQYAPNDARARLHPDAIAIGEYSHNCHGTDHTGPLIGGRHTGEFYKGVAPYQIPYGVLVPKTMRNLLVPTACSASHVGFCALRLEPIWMSLGGAAGYAADMALAENVSVQEVDVEALKRRVWSRGGATIHVSDVRPGHPDFIAVQWWGSLGGFHGIEPAPAKPGARGKHIVSQYFEAFPGHAARLDAPLDEELATRWNQLARRHGLSFPATSGTRGDWIRAAFAAANQ